MKKFFTSIVLATIAIASASAQIADGFYYVKNRHTGRYISIQDITADHYSISWSAGTAKLAGVRTLSNWADVCTMPSCVIYIKRVSSNQYDFEAQGSSLYKLTGNKLYPTLTPQGDGSYIGSGTHSGMTVSLSEWHVSEREESWLDIKNNSAKFWIPVPINTGDNYLGIKPDVKTDDGYYGTIYAGFAFKLASDGMKAYYVSEMSNSKFTLKEISGTIPAATPVIIKCASNDPKKNKILPVKTSGIDATANKLNGVYCSCTIAGFVNVTTYNPSTMRVIGVSGGKLAFVKATGSDLVNTKYLKGNKAYLSVPSGSADVITESGTGITTIMSDDVTEDKEGLYTLTGVKIPDNVTPKPGIYIKDGKKIIIK